MEGGPSRIAPECDANLQYEFHEFIPSVSNMVQVKKQEPETDERWWTAVTGTPGTADSGDLVKTEDEYKPGVHVPLSIETEDEQCAGSLNECGVCGPEKAIWVPVTDETGEPLIEPTSSHGQTIKIDPIDTFWIQCDECSKWFHGSCVGVEEYEDVLIDKFHCPQCAADNGPTKMKSVHLRHRFAFDDMSQADLPPEVGTEVWIKEFIKTEAEIPPPNDQYVIICKNGFEFMDHFNRRADWKKVYLIQDPRGLELRVPDREDNFTLRSIVDILGRSYRVDTIDVYRQMTQSMSIGTFYEKMIADQRPRLYNILSLEFSQNEKMKKLIAPPILVPELSFVHKLWPDRSDLVNWDPELNQVVEVLEEHRSNKPEVALFTLTGMAGSYTDFHIDFGGSSVWYHIYEGQKIFYIVEPTDKYLSLFENYQRAENRTEKFFGDLVPPGALRRVVIEKGQTLMIPSGWIHAVYTPQDSLVFGGNFLHALNVPMQLKVYEMEQRLKKEVGTEEKFLFPQFELVNWYAARSLILESLREANDEGNRADQYIMDAAQALLPRLREWMRRDREEQGNMTPSSFNDVIMKLQREVNKQQRIRRSQSPARRSPKKTAKKRKSTEKEIPIEDAPAPSVSDEKPKPPSPSRSPAPTDNPSAPTHDIAPTHIGISISSTEAEMPSEAMDDESPLDIRLKIVKKGNNYASSVVEKPDPMLEDVNMTQMFARRSSSGRQPRPSAWLAEAVGLDELERTAKKLEEQGEQLPEREVVTYDTEMELACEEEERSLMREERARKKGKTVVGAGDPLRAAPVKRKPSTVKQRLAAKLKLK